MFRRFFSGFFSSVTLTVGSQKRSQSSNSINYVKVLYFIIFIKPYITKNVCFTKQNQSKDIPIYSLNYFEPKLNPRLLFNTVNRTTTFLRRRINEFEQADHHRSVSALPWCGCVTVARTGRSVAPGRERSPPTS